MQKQAARSVGIERQGNSTKLANLGAIVGDTVVLGDIRMYKGGTECTDCTFGEGDTGTLEVEVTNSTSENHTLEVWVYLGNTAVVLDRDNVVNAESVETLSVPVDWNTMEADAGTGTFDLNVALWEGSTKWDADNDTGISVTLQEAGNISLQTPGMTDSSLAPGESTQFQAGFSNDTGGRQTVTVSFQLGNLEIANVQETISTGDDVVAVTKTYQTLRDIPLSPGDYTFSVEVTQSSTGFTGSATDGTFTIEEQAAAETVSLTSVGASKTSVAPDESITFQMQVENTMDQDRTVDVHWEFDNTTIASKQTTITSGQTETVTQSLTYADLQDLGIAPGTYTLTGVLEGSADWPSQSSQYGQSITVEAAAGEQTLTLQSASASDYTLAPGESTTFQATVSSSLDADRTPTVKFMLEGTRVGSGSSTVQAGQTTTISHTLTYSDLVDTQGFTSGVYTLQAVLQPDTAWSQQTVAAPTEFAIQQRGKGGGEQPFEFTQQQLLIFGGIAAALVLVLVAS